MTDTTTSLLAVKILPANPTSGTAQAQVDSIANHLTEAVHGNPIPFTDESISSLTDIAKVRKIYKLSVPSSNKGHTQSNGVAGGSDVVRDLEPTILGLMAIKGS